MRILVVSDFYINIKDEKIYISEQSYYILKRYFEHFGKMDLCCRVHTEAVGQSHLEITEYVNHIIPYRSFGSLLKGEQLEKLREVMDEADMFIFRQPTIIGALLYSEIKKYEGRKIYSEVMGDTWDAYWNHGVMGKIIAPYMYYRVRKMIRESDYSLYVTDEFLQERYPCNGKTVGVSNVVFPDMAPESIQCRLDKMDSFTPEKTIKMATTAAVNVRYKGQEYVIKAIPLLNQAGIRVCYTLIGGGDQTYLRQVAEKYHVTDQVVFKGRLTLNEVFAELDHTDIYIQPSLQEGLPRSVVEAMTRGCAVIGARTGGIPELILSDFVVKRKSARDIANKILKYCRASTEEKKRICKRNFDKSTAYSKSLLDKKRNAFYETVKSDFEIHHK